DRAPARTSRLLPPLRFRARRRTRDLPRRRGVGVPLPGTGAHGTRPRAAGHLPVRRAVLRPRGAGMNDDPENPWADSAETARTFDAASGDFDELTPTVWGPAGQALVFQLGVAPDEAVLDACCGTGSSALPAAAVGPEGLVHGVDVAD